MEISARSSERALPWAYAAAVSLFTLLNVGREPYDDSLFFKRFARNFLEHGVFAWNAEDGPVYGNTSQLFQGISLFLTALTDRYTLLLTRGFAVACVVFAFFELHRLTVGHDRGLAVTFAFVSPVALFPVLSGMETTLVFVLGAIALRAMLESQRRLAVPLLIWFTWLARPDAILLLVPVLIAAHHARTRRFPLTELALTTALVAASLMAFKAYYGTALPLPFYAKARFLSHYDAHFLALSNDVRTMRFGSFLLIGAPLFALACRGRDALQAGFLGGVAAFTAYHFLFTVDVMGMQGRFYAPALPLLVVAAARGSTAPSWGVRSSTMLALVYAVLSVLLIALVIVPRSGGSYPDLPPMLHLAVTVLAGTALLLFNATERQVLVALGAFSVALVPAYARQPLSPFFPDDDEYLRRQTAHGTVFRGGDVLGRCFGDALHVYHSEMGLPGLRFAHGTVDDFVGLMTPAWLFGKQSIDARCAAKPPHAIFLPHRVYEHLNAVVLGSECIRGYERVVKESASPLYVRKDLVARYRQCEAEATGFKAR